MTEIIENVDFDIESAKIQRRNFRLFGAGGGFSLAFLPTAFSGNIGTGIGMGIFVALIGYVIAEVARQFVRNQRLLAKVGDNVQTSEATNNETNNLSLPQALGATAGIVIIAFLVQTLFGSDSDPAKLSTASAKDGHSTLPVVSPVKTPSKLHYVVRMGAPMCADLKGALRMSAIFDAGSASDQVLMSQWLLSGCEMLSDREIELSLNTTVSEVVDGVTSVHTPTMMVYVPTRFISRQ